MKKYLKPIAFSLMGVIILLLIVATVCEKIISTEFAVRYFYTAPWTIALWALAVIFGGWYLFTVKMYRQVITCLLHFSFVIILGGALITHLFGETGEVHLRMDEAPVQVLNSSISASLQHFHLDYYPGTRAPMDFVSDIELCDGKQTVSGQVAMNQIFSFKHYRFYQSKFDDDALGTTLSVSHDPWGIGVTYCGYGLLLFAIIAFFFQKRTRFRDLVRKLSLLILLTLPLSVSAAPKTLQRPVAASYGNLLVYYNDRVCPFSTVANDFCTKLYGKPSYQGLTAEQVLVGWLYYYDAWVTEPMIKIKGDEVKKVLHAEGKYVSLRDYIGNGSYKLDPLLKQRNKNALAADEKFQLISMACMGTLYQFSPLPMAEPGDEIHLYLAINEISRLLAEGRNVAANDSLIALRQWQLSTLQTVDSQAGAQIARKARAEQILNHLHYTRPLAMGLATLGILLFIVTIILLSRGRTMPQWLLYILVTLMACVGLFLAFVLGLRWLVGGHIPLSNGFETMQFLAWITTLITVTLTLARHASKPADTSDNFPDCNATTTGPLRDHNATTTGPLPNLMLLSFGYLISGMTLMVSMMSGANPQITNLMPVLQSPLLTMHVAIIMIAYCLLAFITLNGITALIYRPAAQQLMIFSQVLLYPAVFCLTIGIFIGAVWANISWGRYWGWDPKEVWALITMLVYAAPLHSRSISFFQKPMSFHIYIVFAFLSVLFTYFGVNFILGGLHAYA